MRLYLIQTEAGAIFYAPISSSRVTGSGGTILVKDYLQPCLWTVFHTPSDDSQEHPMH